MTAKSPAKSAEALRVEAHDKVRAAFKAAFEEDTNLADVAGFAAHSAISRAVLAAEVAEQMHVQGCDCHEHGSRRCHDMRGAYLSQHPALHVYQWADPRCTEARARYREEMERVSR